VCIITTRCSTRSPAVPIPAWRLVDGLADERFDHVFAPRTERRAEASAKSFDANQANTASQASPSSTWTPLEQRISVTACCWPDSKS
jgi:hypothetical protein